MWCRTDPERTNCCDRSKDSAATEDPNSQQNWGDECRDKLCVSENEAHTEALFLPVFNFWTFKASSDSMWSMWSSDEFQSGITGEKWQLDCQQTVSSSFETHHIKTPKRLHIYLKALLYHIEHFRWMLVPTFKHIPKRRTLTEMAFLLLLFFHSYHLIFFILFYFCVCKLKGKIHLKTLKKPLKSHRTPFFDLVYAYFLRYIAPNNFTQQLSRVGVVTNVSAILNSVGVTDK